MISRRTFVVVAGAAIVAAPRFVWAQAAGPSRRIAIVNAARPVEELTSTGHPMYVAFHDELARRGYVEGETVEIELWSGRDWTDRDALARAVVASAPDLIYAGSGSAIGPHLLRQTRTIPIVFMARDPVRYGLVTNPARPGGNATGVAGSNVELEGKRLQLLVEAIPFATQIGYITPRWSWSEAEPIIRAAASTLGISLVPKILADDVQAQDYRSTFDEWAREGIDGFLVSATNENIANVKLITELALATKLPGMSNMKEFAEGGGLMSYGFSCLEQHRRAAEYVARILDGEDPGELPVRQPEIFELVVNLTAAKKLGLTIPNDILYRANEVIE